MRRGLIVILSLTLLTVACKQKGKNEAGDSVPQSPDTPTSVDTVMPEDTNTVVVQPGGNTLQIHEDSAEITNLRLITRKQRVLYSPSLLVGEWINGTEHEEYYANGTGRMWDTSEDVSRDEAQRFEWTLDSNLLTIICHLELGGVLPKRYVVTFADDENLSYKDLFGKAFLWDKKEKDR